MIPNDAPRDPIPGEETMEADYARYCAMEEAVPEGLRYHPLIVSHDWTRTLPMPLEQYTETQLRAMTDSEVPDEA